MDAIARFTMNDTHSLLDDLLSAWHCWSKGYQYVNGIGSSPMFNQAKTSRQWDSVHEVLDRDVDSSRLKAVDFHVSELIDVYRTAIQINARNLATGMNVWNSPRLPTDHKARAIVVSDARATLLDKLTNAGIV